MYQEYILKFIGKLTFVTVKLFGLWPYNFDSKSQTFTTNSFFLIYSFIFPWATIILYSIYNRDIFSDLKYAFSSFGIEIICDLYYNVLYILYITLYLGNYWKFNKIKKLIINGPKICTWSDSSEESMCAS